jgi:hypothetical protein
MATTDGFGSQKVRRLSSLDADRAELYGGPNVVMPPKYLMASARDRDLASDIEMDKNHSDEEAISSEEESSSAVTTPLTIPPMAVSDDFALAFDIDGVLIRGGQAIPEAIDAMKYINGENPYGVKV